MHAERDLNPNALAEENHRLDSDNIEAPPDCFLRIRRRTNDCRSSPQTNSDACRY